MRNDSSVLCGVPRQVIPDAGQRRFELRLQGLDGRTLPASGDVKDNQTHPRNGGCHFIRSAGSASCVQKERCRALGSADRQNRVQRTAARPDGSGFQDGTNLKPNLGQRYRTAASEGSASSVEERHRLYARHEPLDDLGVSVEKVIPSRTVVAADHAPSESRRSGSEFVPPAN
ncbi:MAG: hypothetical protein ACYCYH_00595 [Steroidobacteraceae bacterium]